MPDTVPSEDEFQAAQTAAAAGEAAQAQDFTDVHNAANALSNRVASLEARVTKLEAAGPKPPPPPPVSTSKLVVGACVGGAMSSWAPTNAKLGPLKGIRWFYSGGLPANYSAVGVPAGVVLFVSYKTPSANTVSFAKSCPAGTRIIYHHEPENDYGGNGAQFVKEYIAEYKVVKAANPNVVMGMVGMDYQYAFGEKWGANGSYLPPAQYCDYYGIDTYQAKPTVKGLAAKPDFLAWWNFVKARGKPLGIIEYGVGVTKGGVVDPTYSARRVVEFEADAVWIAKQGNFNAWLLWYFTGAQGDWKFNDAASIAAWKTIAASYK